MIEAADSSVPFRKLHRRVWLVAAIGCLGACLMAGIVWWQDAETEGLQALLSASGQHRLFEARLTGQGEFRPTAPPGEGGWTLTPDIERRLALESIRASGTVEAGLFSLVRGRLDLPRDRQRGIEWVEESLRQLSGASRERPQDAGLLNDLAVAQLFAGQQLERAQYLVEALENLDRAVALQPSFEEGRFNRALALEMLRLPKASRSAWEDYLQLDPSSPWATEAREHLAGLEPAPALAEDSAFEASLVLALDEAAGDSLADLHAVISRDPQAAREYGEQTLLSQWASAWSAARAGGELPLMRAATLGAALAAANGDRLLEKAVAAILRARQVGDRTVQQTLAGAHQAFETGLDLVAEKRFSSSLPHFDSADRGFSAGESPMAGWARYYRAFGTYLASDYEATLRLLEEIEAFGGPDRYPSLLGRTLRFQGLVQEILGNHSRALELYRHAYGLFEALGEEGNLASLSTDLAGSLAFLGEEGEAWSFRFRALATQRRQGTPGNLSATYSESARALRRQGKDNVALYFQQEAFRLALEGEDWPSAAAALRSRAALEAALGEGHLALESIEAARTMAELHLEGLELRLTMLDIDKVHGRLLAKTDPEGALAILTDAVTGHRETSYRYVLPSLLLSRAQILRRIGRQPEAEEDLREAIEEIERQRTEVAGSQQRISYFDQVQDAFEELVLLLEDQGRLEEALSFDEAARARVLQDWTRELGPLADPAAEASASLSPSPVMRDLLTQLPAETAVVQLRVFEQRLLIWVLGPAEIARVWVEVREGELDRRVRDLRRAILAGDEVGDLERPASALFELLVEPLRPALEGSSRLVFIPHGPLHDVPFAVLFDRARGRFLVEDYVLSVSPSIAALVHTWASSLESSRRASLPALVVGDPAFDHRLFPMLSLPAARKEAEEVAALYGPGARLLLGNDATLAAFLAAAPEAQVIHLAAHAQPDAAAPLTSRLLLARDGDVNDGRLEVRDLLGMDLRATRLVVLSACATALGSNSKSEGVQNLARPFLAAGVDTVVATLWNIDDSATASLMVRFHQHVRQGLGAAEALRETQLEALTATATEPPGPTAAVWAAFEVVGGGY